jgi:hypothetical protein
VTDTITYSTLFLTLLMVVGLVFFIRASTKDRIETLTLVRPTEPLTLLQAITAHFEARSYVITAAEASPQRLTFRGRVRPSIFLASFLTLLAAVGALCFALVLANLWPAYATAFLGLLGLAPAAGWFYCRGADRDGEITIELQPPGLSETSPEASTAAVTVTAHRDELIALEQSFGRQG